MAHQIDFPFRFWYEARDKIYLFSLSIQTPGFHLLGGGGGGGEGGGRGGEASPP